MEGSSVNISLFCCWKLNLLGGFIETNCHPNSCRAGQAGIPWPLQGLTQPVPKVHFSKLITGTTVSSTIFHHSCLWCQIPSLTYECQGCTACTEGPFPTHLFPALFQSLLSYSWNGRRAAGPWGLASTSPSAKGSGRILCTGSQSQAEISSLLTHPTSNSFHTCCKGKTGEKSGMDKERKRTV